MKVCFISFEYPPKIFGGLGTYAEHLATGLEDRGINVCTITRGDKTICDQKMYRVFTPDVPYWQRFFFIRRAISLLHNLNNLWKFDLVHFNGSYPTTRSLKIPKVCTFHSIHIDEIRVTLQALKSLRSAKSFTDLLLKNPVGGLFDITTARASDKIICPSPFLAREIQLYCHVDEQKIHAIPNGIDLESFDRAKPFDTTLLNKYDIEKGNFLLYMGRLSSVKGVEYLIKGFGNIKKEYKTLKLVIAGSGDLETYLRKFVHKIEGIIFLGFVDSLEVKKLLYETSFTVVVPSIHEVLPMVLLEAMACGKPVIATNVGSIPLIVKHGKNGFLMRSKDPVSLTRFIKFLYENPNLARKMGTSGRKLVEKEFTLDKMISKTIKVYESLC